VLSKPIDKIRERAAEDAQMALSADVSELRWTRSVIAQTMTRINEIAGHLEADPLYAEMKELQGVLSDRKAEERNQALLVRKEAVAAYEVGLCDGKKVVPGVSIRVSKRFKYDVAEALAWCAKDELMVKSCTQTVLKSKEYEAVAVALGGPIEEVEIASAAIAKDLDKALGWREARIVQLPPAGETKAEEPPF